MNIIKPTSAQPIPADAQCVFQGKLFSVHQWEQILYDGSVATFEKVKRPDTVIVIVTTSEREIILVEQEQPGQTTPILGAAGGRIEPDEDVLEAAKRELLEETGYRSDDWVLWEAEQPLAKVEWALYTFVARNAKRQSDQTLDAGEKITLRTLTLDEFITLGTSSDFSEKNLVPELFRATYIPAEKEKLAQLLFGHDQ